MVVEERTQMKEQRPWTWGDNVALLCCALILMAGFAVMTWNDPHMVDARHKLFSRETRPDQTPVYIPEDRLLREVRATRAAAEEAAWRSTMAEWESSRRRNP
jgi:hypothetical protein